MPVLVSFYPSKMSCRFLSEEGKIAWLLIVAAFVTSGVFTFLAAFTVEKRLLHMSGYFLFFWSLSLPGGDLRMEFWKGGGCDVFCFCWKWGNLDSVTLVNLKVDLKIQESLQAWDDPEVEAVVRKWQIHPLLERVSGVWMFILSYGPNLIVAFYLYTSTDKAGCDLRVPDVSESCSSPQHPVVERGLWTMFQGICNSAYAVINDFNSSKVLSLKKKKGRLKEQKFYCE